MILKMGPIEIGDLPMNSIWKMVMFHSCLHVYQRVWSISCELDGHVQHVQWFFMLVCVAWFQRNAAASLSYKSSMFTLPGVIRWEYDCLPLVDQLHLGQLDPHLWLIIYASLQSRVTIEYMCVYIYLLEYIYIYIYNIYIVKNVIYILFLLIRYIFFEKYIAFYVLLNELNHCSYPFIVDIVY